MKIAIIGSGSSAFAAGIYATSKGAEVKIIESGTLGGTCVNVGCVPSKIFIRAAQLAHDQQHHSFAGLSKSLPTVSKGALAEQQQARVEELRQAKYQHVLDSNPNIQYVQGFAHFINKNTLAVDQSAGDPILVEADSILIATGNSPSVPDIPGLQDVPYWTSTEALQSNVLPEHLVVIGASVVATELAQAFSRLGSKVTMIARSTVLSGEDSDIGEGLASFLQEEGMNIMFNTGIESVLHDGSTGFLVNTNKGQVNGDQLLLAAGRQANTAKLGLENVGVQTDAKGQVIIDEYFRTNVDNIFAAGDCTNLPQYVYVAAAAGTRAAANMLGKSVKLDLSVLPKIVFTDPQVATIGLTAAQAEAKGIPTTSRVLTLDNVPRALANFDTRGFIKLVANSDTHKIVGAHILAPEGSEIVQTIAIAMSNQMTVTALSSKLFPYLTMVEGLKLCAQTFTKDVKQLSCCADSGVFDEEVVPATQVAKKSCCGSKSVEPDVKAIQNYMGHVAIASATGLNLIENKAAISYFFTEVIPVFTTENHSLNNSSFLQENGLWIGAHALCGAALAYSLPVDTSVASKALTPALHTLGYAGRQLFYYQQKQIALQAQDHNEYSIKDFVNTHGYSMFVETAFVTLTSASHNMLGNNYKAIVVDGVSGLALSAVKYNYIYGVQNGEIDTNVSSFSGQALPYIACLASGAAMYSASLFTRHDFVSAHSSVFAIAKATMAINMLSLIHQTTSLVTKSVDDVLTSIENQAIEFIKDGIEGFYQTMNIWQSEESTTIGETPVNLQAEEL